MPNQTTRAVKTNAETAGWSRRYQTALRKHLKQGPEANLRPAHRLGREALTLGLQTLDVATSHEQALTILPSPGGSSMTRQNMIEQAKNFFAETIVPIEKTHAPALNAGVRVNQLTQKLRRRTMESSASTRRLKRSIIQRQRAEESLKKSGERRIQLLAESHRMQKRLRDLIREMLLVQEDERQKTSRQLHDDIAQTLIAIELRLLTLKKAAKAGTASLKKEIVNSRQFVKTSGKTISRVVDEYSIHSET